MGNKIKGVCSVKHIWWTGSLKTDGVSVVGLKYWAVGLKLLNRNTCIHNPRFLLPSILMSLSVLTVLYWVKQTWFSLWEHSLCGWPAHPGQKNGFGIYLCGTWLLSDIFHLMCGIWQITVPANSLSLMLFTILCERSKADDLNYQPCPG